MIYLDVSKDGWTGGYQISIGELDENGAGSGYRIAGPKFNGSSNVVKHVELTENDARKIMPFLEKLLVTPATTKPTKDKIV